MPKKTVLVNLEEAWTYAGKTYGPGRDVEVPEEMAQNLVDANYLQARQVRPIKEAPPVSARSEEPAAVAVEPPTVAAEDAPPADVKQGRRKGDAA